MCLTDFLEMQTDCCPRATDAGLQRVFRYSQGIGGLTCGKSGDFTHLKRSAQFRRNLGEGLAKHFLPFGLLANALRGRSCVRQFIRECCRAVSGSLIEGNNLPVAAATQLHACGIDDNSREPRGKLRAALELTVVLVRR